MTGRVAVKVFGGLATLVAALGAWSLGKRAGRSVARATTPPPAPPRDPETGELIADAEEVPAR
ncbi:MAG: hypothetical protein ACOZNI_21080 [Myxococcota bacterium]